MPKLVIKQDVGTAGRKARQGRWVSLGGLLLLLVTVAGAAYFFTRPVITSPIQVPLVLDSAQDQQIKAKYLSMHAVFNQLGDEYEKLSAQGLDDYQKNTRLLDKSEGILAHLDTMNTLADQLGLDDDEYGQLFNRHQFNKDYWQAKSHFRQLRISRFESGGNNNNSADADFIEVVNTSDASVQEAKPKKKFQFAKPPEGMELPAGFCDLSNPDSCKPEAATDQLAEDLLPLSEDSESVAEGMTDKPKKKFQFAKPPKGMELPAGFCDLSNPDSCKPDTGAAQLTDAIALPEDVPASEGVAEAPRKFKFAKPPPGMEMPEGFCDLSNAASCKPDNEVKIAGDEKSNAN